LDASFSLDGVIGAFAFTIFVPLILIGNGVGAFVVNGAMYSIGMLGALMILESFGKEHPFWLAPLNTFILISLFLYLSYRELKYYEKHQ
jgi:hypothetical protein